MGGEGPVIAALADVAIAVPLFNAEAVAVTAEVLDTVMEFTVSPDEAFRVVRVVKLLEPGFAMVCPTGPPGLVVV